MEWLDISRVFDQRQNITYATEGEEEYSSSNSLEALFAFFFCLLK
jgi:hypothetical protein